MSESRAPFRLLALGDAALTLEFGQTIDPAINARVLAFARRVQKRNWRGIRDIVPTYRSLTIHVDPVRVDLQRLADRLIALSRAAPQHGRTTTGHQQIIPVLYGGAAGPDLDDVAVFAKLSLDQVIHLHSSVPYRVYMLGFTPGFPYLGRVPEPLAMPRLASPRTMVPAGSVGIAENQTGIYPTRSPGGWRLIGRTPLPLYRPGHRVPFLLGPGDVVRFLPITLSEFARLQQEHHADSD